ncbi:NUDIX hydrolase [Ensifer adhaerens]|uniref:NUDIX hydrolase n=1 Tax=Ensifer adhaerens TaxID=106592 RepID=UPI00098EB7E3|nr:NUDIX domain-containing protein [Ensifer adhaerens]
MHEIPIRSFAVSVVVLRPVATAFEVLLLKRTGTLAGTWCQVAGAIEAGETAWQAGVREVEEETGLRLDRFYSADICEQFYEADRNAISLLPVFVGFAPKDAAVRLNAEHSDFRWVNFDEAIRMVPFAGQRKVLKHVRDEFVDNQPNPWLLIRETVPAGPAG